MLSLGDLVALGKEMGARGYAVYLFPAALFAVVICAFAWSGAPGEDPGLDELVTRMRSFGVREAFELVALMFAGLVLIDQLLTRVLWGAWGVLDYTRLPRIATELQRFRLDLFRHGLVGALQNHARFSFLSHLSAPRRGERSSSLYPRNLSASEIHSPTQLGVAMSRAYTRGREKYGL